MSGRFVRASKYRHVHGEPARKDKCFNNVRSQADGDGNCIKANKKFLGYSGVGGGGPVVVHPLKNVTRFENSPPAINVHKAKVLDLDFSPFLDNLVATCAEDCLAKVTLFPENGLTADISDAAATLEGHTKKVSLVHFHPVANNVLGSSGYDFSLKIWDIQKAQCVLNYDFPEVPLSFEWNDNGSQIVVACKDKTIRTLDPRNPGAAQSTQGLPGARGSRTVWADNKGRIITVGFSVTSTRQYMIHDPRNFAKPITVGDIDQSAGVLMPFYDPDNSVLYVGGKGDGNIRYFELTDEDPFLHYLSEFRSNESQKGLAFLPKLACDTGPCEIALGLRLMKDMIQPVSFQVPRKSDMFQSDLYPDTYAGLPALSEAEWFGGANKDAPKASMKDKDSGQQRSAAPSIASPTFLKPAAELQKELNEAHARIAQLEAELAKLKTGK